MILNEQKIIFFHIPKCGGSTIKAALRDAAGQKKKKWRFLRAQSICKNSTYNDYKKFTIVRNPWARTVSYYLYLQQWRGIIPKSISFDDVIKNKAHHHWLLPPELSVITFNGKIAMDWMCKLEELEDNWKSLSDFLGMELGYRHCKKTNKEHDTYHGYYTNETKDIVYKRYKKDIHILGYEF